MPLSEYECRVLEQLEHDFTITDPDLSTWLATGVSPTPPVAEPSRLHLALGTLAHWPRAHLLPALAIALMIVGAVLVGVAEVAGMVLLFAAAGVAYLAGVIPLYFWLHRRGSN